MDKLVIVFGAFDGGIHAGHKKFLQEAKKYGDILDVFVATDEEIHNVKVRIPIYSLEKRMKQVAALPYIHEVHSCGKTYEETIAAILALHPYALCFGGDQIGTWADDLEELLQKNNINVYRLQRSKNSHSTTKQIAKYNRGHENKIQTILFDASIMEQLQQFSKLKEKLEKYFSFVSFAFEEMDSKVFQKKYASQTTLIISNKKELLRKLNKYGFDTILYQDYVMLLHALHNRHLLY